LVLLLLLLVSPLLRLQLPSLLLHALRLTILLC
jgi:hypothetical protein